MKHVLAGVSALLILHVTSQKVGRFIPEPWRSYVEAVLAAIDAVLYHIIG